MHVTFFVLLVPQVSRYQSNAHCSHWWFYELDVQRREIDNASIEDLDNKNHMRTTQWPTHRSLDIFALERTLGRYHESFRKRVKLSQRAACVELSGQPDAFDHAFFHNHNEQHARRKEAIELTTTPKPSPSPTSAFSASLICTLLDSWSPACSSSSSLAGNSTLNHTNQTSSSQLQSKLGGGQFFE